MLNVLRCPNCGKRIKTDQSEGQSIPCPYCKEVFTISPEDAVLSNPTRDALFRLAIPLGYVLFVAVPLVLTIWFLTNRAEKQEREAAEAAPAPAPVVRVEKKEPAPRPPVVRPKGGPPTGPGKPAGPDTPAELYTPEPDPTPTMPAPKVELAVAPRPRELPDPVEVFVAPEPREIVWKFPTTEYTSPWQKAGSVDLRVAGVGIGRVPLIDTKERVRETAQPMLVVVIEVRMNAAGKKRELLSWTHAQLHYASAFLAGGKDLPHLDVPLGSKVNSGLPLKQPIPADGEPVRDVLVFAVPPDGSGEVSLRLDGDRCGEPGDIWFKIPATALKK